MGRKTQICTQIHANLESQVMARGEREGRFTKTSIRNWGDDLESDPEGKKALEKPPENPPKNQLEISFTGKSKKKIG